MFILAFDLAMDGPSSTAEQESRVACCHVTKNSWLKLISTIAVPLIIGAFTVIVAVQQQKVAQSNREKDAALAADLRQKDLENALAQRQEDNEMAQSVRAEDKETARFQRELDLNMTKEKLLQENQLAEEQRLLSTIQREHDLQIAYQNHLNEVLLEDERQKENILVTAQRQLATLLLDYGLSFEDPYDRFRFVIQMKTRAALRLLNPARRTILVRSLYQANLFRANWRGQEALLFRANVSGVHFGHPADDYEFDYAIFYEYLAINEADIRHASFRQVSFTTNLSFDHSNLDNTDWSYASLLRVSFKNRMSMNDALFFQSTLKDVLFEEMDVNRISFENNKVCSKCVFRETSMLAARLDHSNFPDSSFTSLSLADSSMYNASFVGATFINVVLDRVNLSHANLAWCLFRNVSAVNCSAPKTFFRETSFYHVDFSGCKGFSQQQLAYLSQYPTVIRPK